MKVRTKINNVPYIGVVGARSSIESRLGGRASFDPKEILKSLATLALHHIGRHPSHLGAEAPKGNCFANSSEAEMEAGSRGALNIAMGVGQEWLKENSELGQGDLRYAVKVGESFSNERSKQLSQRHLGRGLTKAPNFPETSKRAQELLSS